MFWYMCLSNCQIRVMNILSLNIDHFSVVPAFRIFSSGYFESYNALLLATVTVLCSRTPEFILPLGDFLLADQHHLLPFHSVFSAPDNHRFYPLFLNSHISETMQCLSFCAWLISLSIYQAHPFCPKWQDILSIWLSSIPLCTHIALRQVYSSALNSDGRYDCSYILTFVTNASVNIGMQKYLWYSDFSSSEFIPSSGIAQLYGSLS
jgi:hypothetical protein